MYDAGLIYRGKYIVNWCPVDKTALSDDEVDTKGEGEAGFLWHFRYPLADGTGHLVVATTRPETMFGDTAVAVHPKDPRYSKLIGKKILLPLMNREIPIIADDYVDPKFGTGCVKITPAHDPNDFQMGLRHNLPQIDVMNDDATMNDLVPTEFRGLDRFIAREKTVSAFKALGLLEKIEDHMVPVGRSYRSKAIIEYRLSEQWFMKMQPLAEAALEASANGKISFFPERWDSYYQDWLKRTRDWCISRQVWWGHRIPVWYHVETGEILVDVETPKVVEQAPEKWRQDEDVLDTWFSSALWPYSTLGWPENTDDLSTFYPTSVLVTGKDIIFFWVARMVMTGLFNAGDIPFHKVLINSIICDEEGETMSKSKGNGIDPLHVIEGCSAEDLKGPIFEARPPNMEKLLQRIEKRFPEGFAGVGADALRYTLLTSASDAQQVQVSFARFEDVGRPFTDKLWNASRLILSLLENIPGPEAKPEAELPEDRWILGRLDRMIVEVRRHTEDYNFHLAIQSLYRFFWDDFCDWYLETVKSRVRNGSDAAKRRAGLVLTETLSVFLRAMHPIMPFITEELWGHLCNAANTKSLLENDNLQNEDLCCLAPYPEDKGRFDAMKDSAFERLQEVIRSIRTARANAGISPRDALEVAIVCLDKGTADILQAGKILIEQMANVSELCFVNEAPAKFAMTPLTGAQIYLNLIAHMDIDAEIEKNKKAIDKLFTDAASIQAKLGNKDFVARAPEKVVQAERDRLLDIERKSEQHRTAIAELETYR
jgi:valyl-tRNA synthetase